jgi:hypothetical protein
MVDLRIVSDFQIRIWPSGFQFLFAAGPNATYVWTASDFNCPNGNRRIEFPSDSVNSPHAVSRLDQIGFHSCLLVSLEADQDFSCSMDSVPQLLS